MASEAIKTEAIFLDEYYDALNYFLGTFFLYISHVILLTDTG